MTLSKRGDYVVRSALCLARAYEGGEYRKIREVVAEMAVPQTFASQILADLVRAGLATSRAGQSGGYRLARPPHDVSLLEVIEAAEGPLRSERCALGDGPCRWEQVCPLHETWGAATSALRETLATTSLATIVERDEALERSEYPPPADSHRHGATTIAVEDWVQVELSPDSVRRRLVAAEPWLTACVKSGYREAEGLRRGIDPTSLPWSPSTTPAVTLGLIEPGKDGAGVRLAWEAGGTRGPSSRFEGTLGLHSLDEERTELRIEGRFRPPAPVAEADLALTERLSRATLRATLRAAAKELERPAGSRRRSLARSS
ncbi:MAG TPA: Rrf2 family transcriptional regulator [Acidimicrobiales bacterium]|nr:Rrf2 family transcriptional regulator [Acidimicrobiales bacterium]